MNFYKKASLFILFTSVFVWSNAIKYTGPETADFYDVKSVISRGNDDMSVKIEGYLVKRISHDRYVFRDVSGDEVNVQLYRNALPKNLKISDKDKVIIRGEVDKDSRYVEIDAREVEVLK